jgi:hypothetical protein
MAAALAASAIANRVLIEPGCLIPRRLTIEGKEMAVENGVGAYILKAGLATLSLGVADGFEVFELDERAVETLLGLSDFSLLLDAGVVEPKL